MKKKNLVILSFLAVFATAVFTAGCQPPPGIGKALEQIGTRCDDADPDAPSCTIYVLANQIVEVLENGDLEQLIIQAADAVGTLSGGHVDHIQSLDGITEIFGGLLGDNLDTYDGWSLEVFSAALVKIRDLNGGADIFGDIWAQDNSEILIDGGHWKNIELDGEWNKIFAEDSAVVKIFASDFSFSNISATSCALVEDHGGGYGILGATDGECLLTGILPSGEQVTLIIELIENAQLHLLTPGEFPAAG